MKMKSWLAAIVSLCLLCALWPISTAVVAAEENLAVNGDLEMGSTNGWETPNAALASDVSHTGKYSLKLNATSAYAGAAFKAIPVRKNATVTVSFYYRYTENPSYSNRYRVYTYKGDNASVGAYDGASASFVALYDTYDTWQQATYTFNSGDYDAIYLKFCPDSFGSYPCYIDDLVVTAEGGDMPNVAPYLTSFGTKMNRPKDAASNLLKQGGFESASGAQWNTATFIKGNLSVVEDPTAPEGAHSLYYNGGATVWHTFPVTVERNTRYTFSAWVKSPRLSENNNATATFGVMNAQTGRFLVYDKYNGNGHGAASLSTPTKQLMTTSPDGEWHLRSVTFDSGSHTTVYIGVYGANSQLYLDDMALFKSANGIEYISPVRTQAIADKPNSGKRYCADEDSLIEGIYMTTEEAQQTWTQNPAWRNGFLSFAEEGGSHGTVLQYTASAHTEWQLHYIDWIDVKPGTSYTLTMDVKRLTAGEGRIALLDDSPLYPKEFYTLSLNALDRNWATYSITFNSDVFSRVGFAIVDGGGSALIDEVRLFETSKAIAEKPSEGIPTLYPEGIGTSVMEMNEDHLGVAFLFRQEGNRIYMDSQHQTNLSSATVIPFGDGTAYTLARMGAVVTNDAAVGTDAERMTLDAVNGEEVIDVAARYLQSSTGQVCHYAVRVINVPLAHASTPIYARPYYVFRMDGEEIVVYGDIYSRSYNG